MQVPSSGGLFIKLRFQFNTQSFLFFGESSRTPQVWQKNIGKKYRKKYRKKYIGKKYREKKHWKKKNRKKYRCTTTAACVYIFRARAQRTTVNGFWGRVRKMSNTYRRKDIGKIIGAPLPQYASTYFGLETQRATVNGSWRRVRKISEKISGKIIRKSRATCTIGILGGSS